MCIIATLYHLTFLLTHKLYEKLTRNCRMRWSNFVCKFNVCLSLFYVEIFSRITGIRKLFGRRQGISKGWFFGTPYVLISKSECVEVMYITHRRCHNYITLTRPNDSISWMALISGQCQNAFFSLSFSLAASYFSCVCCRWSKRNLFFPLHSRLFLHLDVTTLPMLIYSSFRECHFMGHNSWGLIASSLSKTSKESESNWGLKLIICITVLFGALLNNNI